jgi:FtsH-binding integral membrane protein
MLNDEEKEFVAYWAKNRLLKKRVLHQVYAGLPLAMVLIVAIFANLFSGWYSRAEMVFFRENSSLVIVLLVAALSIVVFVVIFSARHRWEQNEQHYRELLDKEAKN